MAPGTTQGNEGPTTATSTGGMEKGTPYEELGFRESAEHEESSLVPQKRRVSIHTAVQLRNAVIVVSIISVIVLAVLGAVTLVGAIIDESSSSFAFALNGFLDALSSLVVIWRFSGSGSSLYSTRREAIACIILGVFFFLSAVIIFVQSVYSLVNVLVPIATAFLWWGSMIDGVACTLLLAAKLYLAVKLESRALLTDAFNTAAGVLLALSTIVSELVYHNNNDIWQLDAIVGVICSLIIFGYGVWIVYESYHCIQGDKVNQGMDAAKDENN